MRLESRSIAAKSSPVKGRLAVSVGRRPSGIEVLDERDQDRVEATGAPVVEIALRVLAGRAARSATRLRRHEGETAYRRHPPDSARPARSRGERPAQLPGRRHGRSRGRSRCRRSPQPPGHRPTQHHPGRKRSSQQNGAPADRRALRVSSGRVMPGGHECRNPHGQTAAPRRSARGALALSLAEL